MRNIFLILLIGFVSACGIQPWVQPYERGYLADPIMNRTRDPISDNYMRHVYEVREAARGAVKGEGGGCGCN